jgi:formate hydrogenlyase subunit 6/NADH:ubiquinone oxidoreductase subunit I
MKLRIGSMVREVLGTLWVKPATHMYPHDKLTMPANFRGKLRFHAERCIGCKLCVRDCPTGAIEIRKVAEKRFESEIDCAKCIYCAQCVDVCPKDALEATGDFELAQIDRTKLKVLFRNDLPPPAPAAPPPGQSAPAAPPAAPAATAAPNP